MLSDRSLKCASPQDSSIPRALMQYPAQVFMCLQSTIFTMELRKNTQNISKKIEELSLQKEIAKKGINLHLHEILPICFHVQSI